MDTGSRSVWSGVRAGEACWIIAGQGLGVTGGMFGVRILTATLDPHAYGQLALGLTIGTIVQQTVLAPLSQSAIRYYSAASEAGQTSVYLSALRDLTARGALAVSAVIVPAAIVLAVFGHLTRATLIAAALLVALLTGANGIVDSLQIAARRRAVVALHQGASQWLRPAIAAGLIIAIGANSAVALLGFVVALLIVLTSQVRYLPRSVSGHAPTGEAQSLTAHYKTQLLHYSWPFSTWGLFTALQLTSDRWSLNFVGDTHALGVYVVAYQVGYQPFMLLSSAAAQLTAPLVFRMAGDGEDGLRVNKALSFNRLLCLLTLAATGLVVVASHLLRHRIIALLAGSQYSSAATYIPWLALAAGLFACGQVASNAFLIAGNTRALITPKVVTALFAVVLNFMGARLAGVTGVVLANVAFSILYSSWIIVRTARISHRGDPSASIGLLSKLHEHAK